MPQKIRARKDALFSAGFLLPSFVLISVFSLIPIAICSACRTDFIIPH